MITLIAAIDRGRVIGKDDTIPWHIPADFRHFKETTMGHPIIMGRKTYFSLPKRPLPGRENLVVTRGEEIAGVKNFPDIESAIDEGNRISKEVFVIGGQSIYEQTIEIADRLLITHVEGTHDGNFFFPAIGGQWNPHILCEGEGFQIVEYLLKEG